MIFAFCTVFLTHFLMPISFLSTFSVHGLLDLPLNSTTVPAKITLAEANSQYFIQQGAWSRMLDDPVFPSKDIKGYCIIYY